VVPIDNKMAEKKLILVDDHVARQWEPFALTRPAGELFFGTMTLRARAERALNARCIGHLADEHLTGFEEPGAPPVLESLPDEGDRIFLLSRFLPELGDALAGDGWQEGPITADGRAVGWYSPAGSAAPDLQRLVAGSAGGDERGGIRIRGVLLEHVWHLITLNPARIAGDIEALFPSPAAAVLPEGVHHWGDHPLIVDGSARVEPGSVFDTSGGPIWLDRGSVVRAFTRLAGPAYIGPDSMVLGGSVEAVSVGPVCRVRGELAESVCVGYVNKQHDGHMGHAYLGRWVNLGAETTNSDLKNNYGTIRIWTPEGDVDTGEIKLGTLVGDHVKTGIGLLLNTGTVIGAGSNLYGATLPPKFVPPFSWGSGEELVEFRLDKFLEVAERAMARRKVELTPAHREQLGIAWEKGRRTAGT
jgi:UDP-N-acetylglucosamine diphosphorylase / glucose-1-phosphate thymidylyltransferase / UDP-N-acetylgalactosamine diphosphorylase / glucosamine-1-phosphate N-acetyltransferase / galactosamine-1-phosphate N-acetyltransferase